MASSGPALAGALIFALPLTIPIGGSLLCVAVSIPGDSPRRLVPEASFTQRERSLLSMGGLLPLAGICFLAFYLVAEASRTPPAPNQGESLVTVAGIMVVAIIVGYFLMIAAMLINAPPSQAWERPVAVALLAAAVVGVFTFWFGGFVLLLGVEIAIPIAVAVAGYTRPRNPADMS